MTEDTILAFDITYLYTMIPQKESIMALCRFLAKCGKYKINNISIDTFAKLSTHVLDNAYFAYENRLFKQIKGGPMGVAITQILAGVYMFEWEKGILAQQTAEKQLYVRFRDDIFSTPRLSILDLGQHLKSYNEQDRHIKLTYEIGKTVNYLDVTVQCPVACTTVYHKLEAPPYDSPHSLVKKYKVLKKEEGVLLKRYQVLLKKY
ncbi:unnamed protein product [Didymodactylos carnosus]|uniref:Reverse transcriptase domain-containing protein n=1 Tax=Didymodactylos carnosus TaxID=1234261 RepID=A0A816AGV1_9BILA|nr:unnamed protein product [Didymodactylos carnosus]CAF1597319.1 unnamed protein product [Didymodactylos carnosus]CAF4116452.1 unnamed protein product [Didymodactylos carnosus]CAF4472698.1 unnamed protein product [Didymodactylos carnosus]